ARKCHAAARARLRRRCRGTRTRDAGARRPWRAARALSEASFRRRAAGHGAGARDARRSACRALHAQAAPRRRPARMTRAWRMLARDARAGELGILAAALIIAVAAVTSVGFFADRVSQ